MGFNSTVVVMNDALGEIESDPEFGKNLASAIRQMSGSMEVKRVDVVAGCHANAAHVVETHHADMTALVSVGGNLGICQNTTYGWRHHEEEGQVKILKEWAKKLGYSVEKLPGK